MFSLYVIYQVTCLWSSFQNPRHSGHHLPKHYLTAGTPGAATAGAASVVFLETEARSWVRGSSSCAGIFPWGQPLVESTSSFCSPLPWSDRITHYCGNGLITSGKSLTHLRDKSSLPGWIGWFHKPNRRVNPWGPDGSKLSACVVSSDGQILFIRFETSKQHRQMGTGDVHHNLMFSSYTVCLMSMYMFCRFTPALCLFKSSMHDQASIAGMLIQLDLSYLLLR